MELPSTSEDQIAQFQAEYQAAFNAGSQDELEAAKCRWAPCWQVEQCMSIDADNQTEAYSSNVT